MPSISSKVTRPRVDARRARKDALLDDAIRAIAEHGLRQTTMDDIAAAASTSKVVLYRYFASKEDLIHSALERIVERFSWNELQPYAGIGTGVREALQMAREDPPSFILLFRISATDPEFGRHFRKYRTVIVDENVKRMEADPAMANIDALFRRMCAESIATLVLDAVGRWVESEPTARDEEFRLWLVESLKGLYRGWTRGFSGRRSRSSA